jgi:GNAT superfamily N-acetyltransferase
MPEDPAQLATGIPGVVLRRLAQGDSLDELTAMLHRAFSRLARMGLNCSCTDQLVTVTRERIGKGECYVAVRDGRLVGTITLYRPDAASESAWYHRRAVASIHQFAVDPEFQDRGLGTVLLKFAEGWARARGYREVALDTPQLAEHLVAFYRDRGYRLVESIRFQGKDYRSVVLSKDVMTQHIACASALRHLGRGQCRSTVPAARSSEGIGRRFPRSNRRTYLHAMSPAAIHTVRMPLRC